MLEDSDSVAVMKMWSFEYNCTIEKLNYTKVENNNKVCSIWQLMPCLFDEIGCWLDLPSPLSPHLKRKKSLKNELDNFIEGHAIIYSLNVNLKNNKNKRWFAMWYCGC